MLFMTIKLTTIVLIYKIIHIGHFSASASTLVIPLWFLMGDVITEVYGYKIARHIIWIAVICQFIFAFLCSSLISFSPALILNHQDAYSQVLGKLPRVTFASSLAIIGGAFINVYVVSKWKILLKGKYFWLRSLGATAVGELVFTTAAYLIEFLGVVPYTALFQLMIISYIIKLILNPLLIIPSQIIATTLKRLEGIDTYDYGTNFNPFKINFNDEIPSSLNPINIKNSYAT